MWVFLYPLVPWFPMIDFFFIHRCVTKYASINVNKNTSLINIKLTLPTVWVLLGHIWLTAGTEMQALSRGGLRPIQMHLLLIN